MPGNARGDDEYAGQSDGGGGHAENGGSGGPMPDGYAGEGGAEYAPAGEAFGGTGSQRPKLSERPEEFSQWSPDDFRKAAREGDPRLPDAIAHLGQSSQGDAGTVDLLKTVLQIVATKQETPGGNAGPGVQPGVPTGAGGFAPPDEGGAGQYMDPGAGQYMDPGAGQYMDPGEFDQPGPSGQPRSAPPQGHGEGASAALRRPAGLLLPVLTGFQAQPGQPRGPGGHGEGAGGHGEGGGAPPPDGIPQEYEEEYADEYPGAPGTAMPGGPGRRGGFRKDAAVRAVIAALAQNETLPAWQTLQELLAGRIDTGIEDARVVDWVLEALIEHVGPAPHPSRQLLRRVIESPRALRTGMAGADGSRLSAKELRRRAVQIHWRYAASAWNSLLGIGTSRNEQNEQSPQQRGGQEYQGYAEEPVPEAGPAAGGHSGPGEAPPAGRQFRRSAAGQYRDPGAGPPGEQSQTKQPPLEVRTVALKPPELNRVLGYLWEDDFLDWVGGQTTRIQNPAREAEFLALAGSLPTPEVRAGVFRALQKRWKDGADVLIERGVFQGAVRDPGMMAVLKSLPRHRGDFNVRPRSGRQTEELQAKISWLKASGYLLLALNEQFYRVAQSNSEGGTSRGALPIDLHEGAHVNAACHLDWPDDLRNRNVPVHTGPLKVHYVRVGQNEFKPEQLYDYKRQFSRTEERKLPNNQGFWFDTYGRGSEPELMRSVDVLVMDHRAGGGGAGGRGYGGDGRQARYTVEVLVIEVPNPAADSE